MSDIIRNPPQQTMFNMNQIMAAQAERIQELEQAIASKPNPAPVLLTDDEIFEIYMAKLARAIESAVLRKNGWGE